jgi:ribosomal protein S18 acetylase RimI-like enzyme
MREPYLLGTRSNTYRLSLELELRACRESDLERLEWFGMFTHHRSIIRDTWQQHLAGVQEMLVVDLDGFPVAQIWVDLHKRADRGGAVLWAVRCLPLLSQRGIGQWMLREAEERLKARGFVLAEIGVEKHNARARRLYEQLGYHKVSELAERYSYTPPGGSEVWALADQWIMHKRLVGAGR